MSKRRINPAFVAQIKRQNPTLTRRELGKLLAERVGRPTVYTDEYIGKLLMLARRGVTGRAASPTASSGAGPYDDGAVAGAAREPRRERAQGQA